MTIFSAALLLFIVMDPFGNVPFFISALKDVAEDRRSKIIVRELLIALLLMLGFLFAGQHVMSALQISESALTASGGVVLFLISIRMVFPTAGQSTVEEISGEPLIVPLAVPYVAGPSALAALLLIVNREPARWPEWVLALVLAWFAAGLIIFSSGYLSKLLGKKALIAIERLMGMILVAIAVQMLMTGIAQFMVSL